MRQVLCCFSLLAAILLAGCVSIFNKPVQELTFVSVSAGSDHTVAVDSDGNVWTWGRNYYGQLGDGTSISKSVPVRVKVNGEEEYLSDIIDVAAGYNHTLALDRNGNLWAWGRNDRGQLGNGAHGFEANRSLAVRVRGPDGMELLSGIVEIAAGYEHSVARDVNGNVYAWGSNAYGQLGDNTTDNRTTPVRVVSSDGKGTLSGIIAIAAGGVHTIALGINGNVWTWGRNDQGQLGIGTFGLDNYESTPVKVKGPGSEGHLSNIEMIAAGDSHSIALDGNNSVWTWGDNFYGQLGIGSDFNLRAPHRVKGPEGEGLLTDMQAVAAGNLHSFATDNNGSVWAWGKCDNGQLGAGDLGLFWKTTPVQTKGPEGQGYLTGVEAIDGGGYYTIALDEHGNAWAWGSNSYGQLGDGTSGSENSKNTPVLVMFPN